MKKRINISIEYSTYLKSKVYIKNLSKFLEACIDRQVEKEEIAILTKNNKFSEEDIEIAKIKWVND